MRSLLTLALAAPALAQAPDPVVVEVQNGEHLRHEPLVRLPAVTYSASHRPRLAELGEGDRTVPVQVDIRDTSLVWHVEGDLEPGDRRRYRLDWIPGAMESLSRPAAVPQRLEVGGQAVATYVTGSAAVLPALPEGVDEGFRRTGYLHPLRTPEGRVVTGDYPASHRHQHGVMAAWTRTRFDGREIDFWNPAERKGRVEHARFLDRQSGLVLTDLRAKLHHLDQSDVFEERALEETWLVSVRATPRWNLLDWTSWQVAHHHALEVVEYHYGGFAYRAPEAWEGADGVRVRTSEGHERAEADGDRARWIAFFGQIEDAQVTVAILSHPGNYRAPQPVRVHPTNPYCCFSPCRLGPFAITRDEPLVNAYRFVLADGTLDEATIEALWRDYAEPLLAHIVE